MKKLFVLVFALVAVISMIFAINVFAADATKVSSANISTLYKADGSEIVGGGMNGGSYMSHMFDGSYGSLYNNNVGSYVVTDFTKVEAVAETGYYVTEIKVSHAGNSKYSLYYTEDGATWIPIVEKTQVGGTATYAVNATAKQVKYVFDTVVSWVPSVQEVEIYGINPADLQCFHTNLTEEGWVAVEGSATCTKIGNQSQACPDCGEVFVRESAAVPALGHDIVTTVTKEGTATEYGEGTLACSRCDYTIDFKGEVNLTDGTYSSFGESQQFVNIIVSSCADLWGASIPERLTDGKWNDVGAFNTWVAASEVDEDEYVLLNFQGAIDLTKLRVLVQNDSRGTLVVSAMNEETGEYEVVKSLQTYDESLGGGAAYEMTLSMLGVTTSSLKIQVFSEWNHTNGYYYKRMMIGEIEALGMAQGCGLKAEEHVHDYSEFVEYKVEPTCSAAGIATYKCVCNDQVTVEVEASDEFHAYESFITLWPTCIAAGTERFTCTICGYEYTAEVTADLEDESVHNYWPDWGTMKNATCIEGGYEKQICENCGKEVENYSEPDTVDGHEWTVNEETYVDATCATDGYMERTCALCETYQEVVLDKTIYGMHDYVADEETFVEATCKDDGYANYTCSVCGDSYEEETPASPWNHDYVSYANYSYYECSACGDYYFYATLKDSNCDYEAYIYSYFSLNICTPDYSFDVYYNMEIVSVVDGVYTVALTIDGEDVLGLVGGTCTITVAENGLTVTAIATDATEYTFTNIPKEEPVDYNALLNGTYSFNPEEGAVFTVMFENGTVYVLADTIGIGLPESFAYMWNPNTGMLNTEEGYFYIDMSTGDLYYGRGWLLSPVVEEEPEVNYGEYVTTLDVVTTDTYGPFDLYSFTAEVAGTYNFFIPANLGVIDRAAVETWGTTPIFSLDYYGHPGTFVPVELAAGQTLEFYIIAETKAEWMIDVFAILPEHTCEFINVVERVESTCTTEGHVTYECSCGETKTETLPLANHVEAEIAAVLPTPSTVGYTAGSECSVCGAVIVAPVEVNITETKVTNVYKINSANLSLQENISVNYWATVTAGYNNPYMVFVFNGQEYIVSDYTINASNGRFGFKFAETFPQYMNSNIAAYLYAETAEGEYAMDTVLEYSVKKYCVNQFKAGDSSLRTVISDVLTLGAMTQVYTGWDTSNLVTDIVAAELAELGLALTPTAYNSIPAECDKQVVSGTSGSIDLKGASLLMGSSTEIKLTFATDDIANTVIKINFAGEEKVYTAEDFVADTTAGRYYVVLNFIKSYEYDEVLTATIEYNGAQVGRTIQYSINTYLSKNVDKASQTDAAKNLMKALYVYGVSIFNHFN